MSEQATKQRSGTKLGAGDSAYILAWSAWSAAEIRTNPDYDAPQTRMRFVQWWEKHGRWQLEQYGYHVLDTGSPPEHSQEGERHEG